MGGSGTGGLHQHRVLHGRVRPAADPLHLPDARGRLLHLRRLHPGLLLLGAPAIANLDSVYAPLPFLIMGGGAVVVGCLSFLLPETRGLVLPETIEEAAALEAGLPCRKNT